MSDEAHNTAVPPRRPGPALAQSIFGTTTPAASELTVVAQRRRGRKQDLAEIVNKLRRYILKVDDVGARQRASRGSASVGSAQQPSRRRRGARGRVGSRF